MKNLITIITLMTFYTNVNAQLLIDDFSTGNFDTKTFNTGESERLYHTGNKIIGKIRRVHVNVGENIHNQTPQLTNNKNNLLAYSSGYDVNSTIYLSYGYDKNGVRQLNLDISKYTVLKIEFASKSAISGMYLALFTTSDRGVYSNHVPEREGKLVFTIPLSEIRKIGKDFTLEDIDHIIFQFDSRSKTGCNMAINKMWFE